MGFQDRRVVTVACGALNEDGTPCSNAACGFAILGPAIRVPVCELHASGPQESAEDEG